MTLEWLLIVAAVAGLAASSALIVQRVVDEAAEAPDDPRVRVLEADVAAAEIAAEANAAVLAPPYDNGEFKTRCEVGLRADFDDIIDTAMSPNPAWSTPSTLPGDPPELDLPARCTVTPRALR